MKANLSFPTVMSAAISKTLERLGQKDPKGGYFRLYALLDPREGYTGLQVLEEGWIGGSSNFANIPTYQIISMEKAIRLADNLALYGHTSSWESRNLETNRYGGAIALESIIPEIVENGTVWIILSLSGLPEVADEAAVLLAALDMYNVWRFDLCALEKIRAVSQNPYVSVP